MTVVAEFDGRVREIHARKRSPFYMAEFPFLCSKTGAHLRHCVYWALEHSELRAIITGTLPVHRPSILGTRTKRSCLQREQKCIGRESNPGLADIRLLRKKHQMATANFTTKPPMLDEIVHSLRYNMSGRQEQTVESESEFTMPSTRGLNKLNHDHHLYA